MGLSIAISGAIILSVLMIVLMTITGFVGNMFTIGDVSSQIFEVENTIANTDISLDALEASSGSPYINFTLNNDDIEKLWNFEHFNVLIEYDNVTTVVEELSFNGDCSGISPPPGNWCIETIGADILDEGIINDGESADVWTRVSLDLSSANALVTVSTDNGVVAMLPAPKRSWIDAAPIPPITCIVGNYGRTFVDTDTGISYACDPSRDKWLSIETMALFGDESGTCNDGNTLDDDSSCNVDWGNGLVPNQGGDGEPLELGLYIPYNFTIIAAGYSSEDIECGNGGDFALEIWGTDSNTDDETYPGPSQVDIVTGLSNTVVYNDNNLDVDVDGDQYTIWGIDNDCSGGGDDINDWNMIVYLKWRHDNP